MIIIKKDTGNYIYAENNKKVTDQKILDYIIKLVIPPAYTNVHIYYPATKIAYTGIDKAGRKQYIYCTEYVKQASNDKYCNLLLFSLQYPLIIRDINALIANTTNIKEKYIALLLKIVINCNFRIGGTKGRDLYDNYGISTINRKHVTFDKKDGTTITFRGKKGIINTCKISDPIITKNLDKIINEQSDKSQALFSMITPKEVNNFLKQYNKSFTTKMFRTYHATINYIQSLRNEVNSIRSESQNIIKSKAQRTRLSNSIIDRIAEQLHNTRAICKKSYIDNSVVSQFIDNPRQFVKQFCNTKMIVRNAYISHLRDYAKCKDE